MNEKTKSRPHLRVGIIADDEADRSRILSLLAIGMGMSLAQERIICFAGAGLGEILIIDTYHRSPKIEAQIADALSVRGMHAISFEEAVSALRPLKLETAKPEIPQVDLAVLLKKAAVRDCYDYSQPYVPPKRYIRERRAPWSGQGFVPKPPRHQTRDIRFRQKK